MNATSRCVLGIDHGVYHTGWGIVMAQGGGLKVVAYGQIETAKTAPFHLRLKKIYTELCRIIQTYQPQEMAVEEAIYAQNIKTALLMGHARGTILLAGANADLPIFAYPPKKIKTATVGNGAATKEQVQFMVRRLLNLTDDRIAGQGWPELTLDVSDALAVAICHLHQSPINR